MFQVTVFVSTHFLDGKFVESVKLFNFDFNHKYDVVRKVKEVVNNGVWVVEEGAAVLYPKHCIFKVKITEKGKTNE